MRDEAAQGPGGDGTADTLQYEPSPSPSHDAHRLSPATSNATTTSSKAPTSRGWLSSVRRPKTSPGPKASAFKRSLLPEDDARRDSALASSNSTASNDQHTHNAPSSPTSLRKTPSLPAIVVQDEPTSRTSTHTSQQSHAHDDAPAEPSEPFHGIDTIIPTGGLDDLTSPSQVSFSKRGSILLGGKRATKMNKQLGLVAEGATSEIAQPQATATPPLQKEKEQQKEQKELSAPATPHLSPRSPSRFSTRARAVSNRVLSTDEMMLSRKVRSMYRHGNESAANWDGVDEEGGSVQTSFVDSSVTGTPLNGSSLTVDRNREETSSLRSSRRESMIAKEPTETAGGVEDWADLEGGEVDRYGFIIPKKTSSRGSSNGTALDGPDEPRIQRVSTALQLVSEEPRRRGIGRSASKARSARSTKPRTGSPVRRRSQRSSRAQGSIFSNRTARSTPQKPLRHAANRLPHNRDRRLMDEASDMLKLPPGLAELAEQADGGRAARTMKAKEIEREEKWRKMAKVVQGGAKSGGMMFEFDTKDPKLVSRTWKGIPDRWRATAWYAFLAASAKAQKNSPTDEELVEYFYELQEESSADDMQIDVDVPRTINRHIMFRRRYRGG